MDVYVEVTIHRWTVVTVEVPDDATDDQAKEAALNALDTATDWKESQEVYILDKVLSS
jgi:hypothetical protein